MKKPTYPRRDFLVGALLVASATAAPEAIALERLTKALGPWLASLELGGLLRDRAAAASVGRAYLRCRPEERNLGVLLPLLFDGEAGPGESLASSLGSRIREDFACARVVAVQGWRLSETEARLCAAVALTSRAK